MQLEAAGLQLHKAFLCRGAFPDRPVTRGHH